MLPNRSFVQWRSRFARLMLAVLVGLAMMYLALCVLPSDEIRANSGALTVHNQVLGQTPAYIGATEAGGFWIQDLNDLGINTYRLWTKMGELEWWDDDGAVAGWLDTEVGTPTITQIRADAASGLTKTIPWEWWDARFDEVQSWRYGEQTRRGIIEALALNNITPLVVLRTYDDQGQPEQRAAGGGAWAPRPPVTETFRNEWWEHCFAMAYWLNVRNAYGVTRFEVLNEPDYNCQGWCNNSCVGFAADFCGTQSEYAQLVLDAHDAISYANSFVGLPVYLHAPVVANYNSPYVATTLDQADVAVQVVDYHTYAADPRSTVVGIRSTIASHNPDGVLEPIWVSEWGALWTSYNTFERALRTASQLLIFAEEGVEGATIFNMYDWSPQVGGDYGLIDLQDDGNGGSLRVPTESYYAYRLMVRGLLGAKAVLSHTMSLSGTASIVTRDAEYVYVLVLRDAASVTDTLAIDLTAIGSGSGAVEVWEYSAANKDVVVATPVMSVAHFSLVLPAKGITLARISRQTLSVRLVELRTPSAGVWIWAVLPALLLLAIVLNCFARSTNLCNF